MADSKEKLFSDFIAPTRQEWLDKINVDLKGADYQKKMVWRTNEGFSAEPFYRKEDLEGMAQTDALPGEFPYLRGNKKDNNRWYVRQNIRVTDPKEANEKALDLLNKGVTSLGFKVPAKELNATFISTLLEGIKADAVELNFSTCQGHTVELARLLTAYYDGKGYDRTALVGSIDFDPMQKILTKGKDTTALLNKLAELVNILAPFPKMRCICINADTLCNAGAYIYQELGYAGMGERIPQPDGGGRYPGSPRRQENQIQLRHQRCLFHGNREVPRRTHDVGPDREAVQSGLSARRLHQHG